MAKATGDNTKRKRPHQTGTLVGVRIQPDQLASIDAWIEHHPDNLSRPEAIRRLIDLGFKGQ